MNKLFLRADAKKPNLLMRIIHCAYQAAYLVLLISALLTSFLAISLADDGQSMSDHVLTGAKLPLQVLEHNDGTEITNAPAIPPAPFATLAPPTAPPLVTSTLPETASATPPQIPQAHPAPPQVVDSMGPDFSAHLADLESKIDRLAFALGPIIQQMTELSTKTISQIETAHPPIEKHDSPAGDNIVTAQPPILTEAPAPTEGAPMPPTSPHHHIKTSVTHSQPPTKNHTALSAQKVHWVLRAADENSAWVSPDVGSSHLTEVKVGDVLKGIGRVKSIHETDDDAWVVVGDYGEIK